MDFPNTKLGLSDITPCNPWSIAVRYCGTGGLKNMSSAKALALKAYLSKELAKAAKEGR